MTAEKKFNGRVQLGDQTGRTIGVRTANLDPFILSSEKLEHGVYASTVTVAGKQYSGVLYYGPRLVKGETHSVLEIHLLDFDADIYGQTIAFTIGKRIRGVLKFSSLDGLREQIADDIAAVRSS